MQSIVGLAMMPVLIFSSGAAPIDSIRNSRKSAQEKGSDPLVRILDLIYEEFVVSVSSIVAYLPDWNHMGEHQNSPI